MDCAFRVAVRSQGSSDVERYDDIHFVLHPELISDVHEEQ